MKIACLFLLILLSPLTAISQDRILAVSSKDSVGSVPKWKGSLGANLKLNGYFDVFGGLQDSETFNVGMINVFGTDDSSSFHMDLYQTQLRLESSYLDNNGEAIGAMVEFDFWGGNGHMRLRKAFVEWKGWQIGQNWNNFGDEVLWPDIMEWEGPPSGVWLRTPHVKYSNTFKNERWIYELSLEAPITNYVSFEEFEINAEEAYQNTPDLTLAIKNNYDWGHIRLSSVLRNVRYKIDGETDNFIGYGFSLSGIYTNERKNNIQFQVVAGEGITAYMTSLAGLGYDGYRQQDNSFRATPAIGGWASYAYYFTPNLHSSLVFGYTQYRFTDVAEFSVITETDEEIFINQGDFQNAHYYGIVNIMYSPFPRMTLGIELDYGVKEIDFEGSVNSGYFSDSKSRDAMRISFGFMFYL